MFRGMLNASMGTLGSTRTYQPMRPDYRENAYVVDLGSHSIKVGSVDGEFYKAFPPYILKGDRSTFGQDALDLVRAQHEERDRQQKDGGSFLRKTNPPTLCTPFVNGRIADKQAFNFLVQGIFCYDLDLPTTNEIGVVVSDQVAPLKDIRSCIDQRTSVAKYFFEQENEILAFQLASQPVFTMNHFNLPYGVVIDVGHSLSKISVVYNGATIPSCTFTSPIAGKMIDELLFKECAQKGLRSSDRFQMGIIKEQNCYVAVDFDKEASANHAARNAELNDGTTFGITRERFIVPEVLFDPSVVSSGMTQEDSLIGLILKARTAFHNYLRGPSQHPIKQDEIASVRMFSRFVLVGGTLKMPGLVDRLRKEIKCAMIDFQMQNEVFDPTRGSELETRKAVAEHLRLDFIYEDDVSKRGKEAFHGAVKYANDASNNAWITGSDIQDRSLEALVDSCPR